jgi:hypothetical protein
LRAGWSGSFPDGSKRARREGIERENRSNHPEVVKTWQVEKKDWTPFSALLVDNFTFSSAAGDDHISKSAFKTNCWDTQINFIGQFDLEQLIARGNEAFAKYLCHTKNGKSFRNVEYFRLRDGKIESIECYFGGKDTFPSAVSKGM